MPIDCMLCINRHEKRRHVTQDHGGVGTTLDDTTN
jgi:hypothetical protein